VGEASATRRLKEDAAKKTGGKKVPKRSRGLLARVSSTLKFMGGVRGNFERTQEVLEESNGGLRDKREILVRRVSVTASQKMESS